MYCNQCGNKLSEGDHFCSRCGKRVEHPAPWTAPASDAFDETMLYRPEETLEALEQTPYDRELAEERHYEREQSARAAQRLREKRLAQSMESAEEIPAVTEDNAGRFLAKLKTPFGKHREQAEAKDLATERESEPSAAPAGAESTSFRHLYMGIVIIGVIIGIILGLFIMKPWHKTEPIGPEPVTAVVAPVELPASE